ncbi:unnamed protein product [Jaminaea pallidilutea]
MKAGEPAAPASDLPMDLADRGGDVPNGAVEGDASMLSASNSIVMDDAIHPQIITGADGKKKEGPQKRVLPARLRRVSALLGGDTLEDWGVAEAPATHRYLPDSTVFVLSERTEHLSKAHEASPSQDRVIDASAFFADPDVARACREKAQIETPDYKLRDDSSQMGKTRGGALRSEEDTSDAAYERRHRRPDNLEKKQRRMEKERLLRDRQRLKDRIEQLKTADPRMLMPIFAARERHVSPSAGASLRGAEASMGLGKQNISAEANANLQKIEQLRKDLIIESTESLARYDALLALGPVPPAIHKTEEGGNSLSTNTASDSASTSGERPSGSSSSLKPVIRRRPRPSFEASPETPARPRAPSSPTMAPAGSPDEDGQIKAEFQYRNIHARTSGGRFAPKAAILIASDDPNAPLQYKPSRAPRPSEIARKARREAERQAKLAGRPLPRVSAPGPAPSSAPRRTASRTTRRYSSPSSAEEDSPEPVSPAAAAWQQRRQANKVGPSLAELDSAERRPKRVRLRLGARPGTQNAAAALAASPQSSSPLSSPEKDVTEEVEEPKPRFSAPGALSLEQAQKMMAAAMAAARGGAAPAPPPSLSAMIAQSTPAAQAKSPAPSKATEAQPSPQGEAVNGDVTARGDGQKEEQLNVRAPQQGTTINPPAAAAAAAAQTSPAQEGDKAKTAAPVPLESKDTAQNPVLSAASETPTETDPSAVPGTSKGDVQPFSTRPAPATSDRTLPIRSSGRVKEQSRGAFGEKLPTAALQAREDFDKVVARLALSGETAWKALLYGRSGGVSHGNSASIEAGAKAEVGGASNAAVLDSSDEVGPSVAMDIDPPVQEPTDPEPAHVDISEAS